jgi:ubiquitin-conjugating enzyme E2 J2
MATPGAMKRLTREYKTLQESPTPYIVAHPSESNILEWHYILTGPPDTPYEGGQFWGTLNFPSNYPFAPPAIRMHTPSGRFQPSTRLCLSISDFHPKSFNPAWGVSTILNGVLSFMTSEEITTGSIRSSEAERKVFAARSRWWNSTGGGTSSRAVPGVQSRGAGAIKAGDGGARFRKEWPDVDKENWEYLKQRRIDPTTGNVAAADAHGSCTPAADALRRRATGAGNSGPGAVVEGAHVARQAGQGFLGRNKYYIGVAAFFVYIMMARILGSENNTTS